jgi:putative ABC transport system permease protein
MFVSTFAVATLALVAIVVADPWYAPRYAIPLLGMLLGNTMTGVALALERLTEEIARGRDAIEDRLALGEDRASASHEVRQECMRAGLIPIVNAMAAAGLVSLPGMMTGQILAGASPLEAVKYQILIMFLIAGSRLRLDRLRAVE